MSKVTRGLGQPGSLLPTAGLGQPGGGDEGLRAFLRAQATATADLTVQAAGALEAAVFVTATVVADLSAQSVGALQATLSVSSAVVADLSVQQKKDEGGGRRRKKKELENAPVQKELNPLIRVTFGDPSKKQPPAEPVVEPVAPEPPKPAPPVEEVPLRGVGRRAVEEVIRRVSTTPEDISTAVLKQQNDDSGDDFYDQAEVIALLELMD